MNHVGGRIKTLRLERQLTLDEVASKSGLSKGLLSKLENAVEPNPSLSTLYKVSEALGVTLSDLLDSGRIRAKRWLPDSPPDWIAPLVKLLKERGEDPDEDILQALYVLQARKSSAPKDTDAWLYMYKSLELNLNRNKP